MARQRQFRDEDIFPQFEDGLTDEQIATPLGVTRQAINKYRTRWQALKSTERITAHIESEEATMGELLCKQQELSPNIDMRKLAVESILGVSIQEAQQMMDAAQIINSYLDLSQSIEQKLIKLNELKKIKDGQWGLFDLSPREQDSFLRLIGC